MRKYLYWIWTWIDNVAITVIGIVNTCCIDLQHSAAGKVDDLQQRYHWRGGWGSCRREGGGTEEPSSSLPWVCAIYQGSRPSARLVCWWIMKVSIDYDTHAYCSNWLGILQLHVYFVGGWWKLAVSMIRDAWCEHWMGSWEPKVCLMMASGTEQCLWYLVLDATIGHGSRGLKGQHA